MCCSHQWRWAGPQPALRTSCVHPPGCCVEFVLMLPWDDGGMRASRGNRSPWGEQDPALFWAYELAQERLWLPRTNSGLCRDGVCFDTSGSLQQPVSPSPACGVLPPAHPILIPSSRGPHQGPPVQPSCSKPSAHSPSLLLQEVKLQLFLHQPGPQRRMALWGAGWVLWLSFDSA